MRYVILRHGSARHIVQGVVAGPISKGQVWIWCRRYSICLHPENPEAREPTTEADHALPVCAVCARKLRRAVCARV